MPRHSILVSILTAFGEHLAFQRFTALKRSLFLGLDRECVSKLIFFRNFRFSVVLGTPFSLLLRPIVVDKKGAENRAAAGIG